MAMESFMDSLMASPEVFIAGIALGFVAGKMMGRRRNSMGMGGGGF